jgi:hypothetical protein
MQIRDPCKAAVAQGEAIIIKPFALESLYVETDGQAGHRTVYYNASNCIE